ncbi:hypothetical protein ACFU6I_06545 [Streptomyces sp. NPDC057486]|uniref:hypothetical protein n=1 Tax=Streptomyces sp. NPDC057486 TaxID=3346145 RepID=UPI00367B067D
MADRTHVRQEHVSAIERGRTTAAGVGTIAAHIAVLGVSRNLWPTSTAPAW